MKCLICNRPVPEWLRETAGESALWCSGTCLRKAFQQACRELAERVLTPEQFHQLMSGKPQSIGRLSTPHEIREAVTTMADAILSKTVEPKQASLVLYALQTAISTLRLTAEQTEQAEFEQAEFEQVKSEQQKQRAGFAPPAPAPPKKGARSVKTSRRQN
jgi:inorganic triphosphatase YgiF